MSDAVHVGVNAKNLMCTEKMAQYSKVVINVDKDISYSCGNDIGTVLEIECPYGTQQMANDIYAKIVGVQYQPYTVESGFIDPSAEIGDAVTTNGVYGGLYTQERFYAHKFTSDYSAPQEEQLDHEYTFEPPLDRHITRLANEMNSKFTITHELIAQEVEKRTEDGDEFRNALSVQSEKIDAKVSQRGGTNSSFAWELISSAFKLLSNSKEVFVCDSNGILVDGTIKAKSGYIGTDSQGFAIGTKYIHNNKDGFDNFENQNGVYLGTDGIALGRKTIMVNNTPTYSNMFSVSNAGVLTAQDANITGTIKAKSGIIGADSNGNGGFTIASGKIYNGTSTLTNKNKGIYLGTDGIYLYSDDNNLFKVQASNGRMTVLSGMTSLNDEENLTGMYIGYDGIALGGGRYKVTSNGALTAKNATIEGKVTASSGLIGGTYNNDTKKWEGGFALTANKFYSDGKNSYNSATEGVYVGTDGIGLGNKAFYVTKAGKLTATDADIKGKITATSGTFEGELKSATGTFKGELSAATGTFKGELSAATGTFKGSIYAKDGYFGASYNESNGTWSGGFVIAKNKMYDKQTTYNGSASADKAGVYIGTDGIGLGKDKFTVTSAGTLTAKDATIDGTIRAKSGIIGADSNGSGGFTIASGKMYTGSTSSVSSTNAGLFLGTDGINLYKDATNYFRVTSSNGRMTVASGMKSFSDTENKTGTFIGYDGIALGGGAFSVTNKGALVANNATLSGKITAKSGQIGANSNGSGGFFIGANKMYNGTDSLSSTAAGVYLGTDGIYLRDDATNGAKYQFKVTNKGRFTFLGGMTGFSDTDNKSGMYIGNDGIALGGGNFKVSAAGDLVARRADLSGKISASSGVIGGWSIGDRWIGNNPNAGTWGYCSIGLYAPAQNGDIAIWAGHDLTEMPPFAVKANGEVVCTKITVPEQNNANINGSALTGDTVAPSKLTGGVRTSLSNGDEAKATLDSLTAGSVFASYLKANNMYAGNLFVHYTGSIYRSVSFHNIVDKNGESHSVLSYN